MEDESWGQCGCWVILLAVNAIVGGWATNYLLAMFLKTDIHYAWDVIIGVVAGQFVIPVAIVVAILRYLGVM